MELIDQIESLINYRFKEPKLLQQAFSHTSYMNERGLKHLDSYERLEFLGDAALEWMVSNYLYRKYPNYTEGELTRLRAGLVREHSLAYLARLCHFDDLMLLGKGEEASGGRNRDSLLSDIYEAFIGAYVTDASLEAVIPFVEQQMDTLSEQNDIRIMDYKTILQEKLQQKGSIKITYELIKEEGPPHKRIFTVEVSYNNQTHGSGQGASKKEAEQQAAKHTLDLLQQEEGGQ
ncbi:ribonuclease III [Atopobacter phocae]|uniref:ribonuclease III n=1 Tax=Atopobacter phocae TaxID=136492 RepID=UPI00046EDB0C|nr:ribonuclease III [Atopobacter phocae]